jgi:hypothetical protein
MGTELSHERLRKSALGTHQHRSTLSIDAQHRADPVVDAADLREAEALGLASRPGTVDARRARGMGFSRRCVDAYLEL